MCNIRRLSQPECDVDAVKIKKRERKKKMIVEERIL
jgi:hypothetical protein